MVQTLDENGKPEGQPTFGVMAADDYEQSYNDTFFSFQELNDEIKQCGCILDLVAGFTDVDKDAIGPHNYYGEYPDA
jgi:hypothetical protein